MSQSAMLSDRLSCSFLLAVAFTVLLALPARAQSPIDIVSGGSSLPSALVDVNGTLFFEADDPNKGNSLWKSDGTDGGTVLVKDPDPDADLTVVTPENAIGSTLYLRVDDGDRGIELWTSDGSTAGTQIVKDINSGAASGANCTIGSFQDLVYNGKLFFDATDGTTGCELWKSDGTANGTVRVTDINGGGGDGNPSNLTVVGTTLYFTAYSGTTYGTEIYKTTGSGATRLTDFTNGPSSLTEAGGTLFFTHSDQNFDRKLYKLDGGSATVVKDLESPSDLTEVNGTLYLSAADSDGNGSNLWKSDGTTAGTQLVKSIPNTDQFLGEKLSKFTAVGSTLYFRKDAAGTTDAELWKSDGTTSGTYPLATGLSSIGEIGHLNSTVFFRATDAAHGSELWWSGGSSTTTRLLKDLRPGSDDSLPGQFTAVDGTLFFEARNDAVGRELWTSETTLQFVESSVSVHEDAGATALTVGIVNPPSGTSVSADVTFDGGSSSASSGDVGGFTTKTVTFPSDPEAGDTETVTVSISSDATEEGTETASFDLTNTPSSTVLGTPSTFDLLILDAADDHSGGDVMITEIMQNPNTVNDDKGEYIELHNASSSSKSVDGWTLKDAAGNSTTLSGVTIPARGFVVVCINDDQSVNGGIRNCADDYANGLALNNGGDDLTLSNGSGTQVDRVNYDGGTNWPDPNGSAMIFTGSTKNNTPSNWTTASRRERGFLFNQSGDTGSPGRNGAGQTLQPTATITGAGGWRLLSPPMTGITPADLADVNLIQGVSGLPFSGGDPNLYQWTGGNNATWTVPSSTDDLTGGSAPTGGFIWYVFDSTPTDVIDPPPFTLSLPGTTPTGNVTADNLDANRTFHLLGNPYAQSYDISGLNLATKGFSTTVQVWDPSRGTYDPLVQDANSNSDIVGPYQGFFVERSTGSNTQLTFDSGGRRADSVSLKRRGGAPPRIEFRLTGRTKEGTVLTLDDALMLRAHPDASTGWDVYDASKLTPLSGRYATAAFRSTRNGETRLRAVASVPSPLPSGGVELPISLTTQGADSVDTFTFTWPRWHHVPESWTLTLHDAVADSTIDLRAHSSYRFFLSPDKAQTVPSPRPLGPPTQPRAKAGSDSARFTLRVQSEALPVELSSFDAVASNRSEVTLTWQTASETNNAGFAIERRVGDLEDGGSWTQVGYREGSGTTGESQRYRFTDASVPFEAEQLTYRLRQEDLDGGTTLSAPTTVQIGAPTQARLRPPFPNPARQQVTLHYEMPTSTEAQIAVYDLLGRRVMTVVDGRVPAGRHEKTLSTAALAPGMYFLQMQAIDHTETHKLTIVR